MVDQICLLAERICLLPNKRGILAAKNSLRNGGVQLITRDEMPDGRLILRVLAPDLFKARLILRRDGFSIAPQSGTSPRENRLTEIRGWSRPAHAEVRSVPAE